MALARRLRFRPTPLAMICRSRSVSERWYSPDLQTVVMTKRNDPRMGETVYRFTNVSRNEPARSLFEAPADYTVTDDSAGFQAGDGKGSQGEN